MPGTGTKCLEGIRWRETEKLSAAPRGSRAEKSDDEPEEGEQLERGGRQRTAAG